MSDQRYFIVLEGYNDSGKIEQQMVRICQKFVKLKKCQESIPYIPP